MDVIHIRWTSKRKSATLRTIMLALFYYRLMKHYRFSTTFKPELLLGQSRTSMASRRSRSLVFAVCGLHGCIVHEHGWSCNGWLSMWGTAWVSRSSSKFRQAVMFALDLNDKWQFEIPGKVPQHHDGSVSVGMSSLDTGITMKHGRSGVGVSISRCRNVYKNLINFTKFNKSFKTNFILKNKFASHLEHGTHWVKHLAPLFVLWNCCTPIQSYCLQNWKHSSDWKVVKKR